MRDPKEIKEFKRMLEDRVIISPNGIAVFKKPDEPEKHTEEIQEIITKVPSWIVRWGIALLFGAILIIAAIAALVPYPEMIKSPLKLQSLGNTISIVIDAPGVITKVFIEKNMAVKKGQPLIEIRKDIDQKPYILKAPNDGVVGFSAIVQPGTVTVQKQELLKLHPFNEHFFGIMHIRKNEILKIRIGQDVIIKLAGTTSQGGNSMRGKVDFVADEPIKDHFLVKVVFDKSDGAKNTRIDNWMEFEAQVIIKKSNLFNKLFGSITDKFDIYN